jgi:F-type H+-transporting ATPase subunit b
MQRVLFAAGLLVGVLVAGPAAGADNPPPLQAEQAADPHGPAQAKGGHGKSSGVLDLSADLGLWTLIVFVLLLLVLRKLAWRPMLEGLQKREQAIHSALEEAQKARDEARHVRAQLQAQLDKAAETVREILDEARRDAQYTKDQMIAEAHKAIQDERARLHREIETAKDQTLQEMFTQTAQLAALLATKAVRRELSLDDHRRLLDEALAELRAAGSKRPRWRM